jgi:hypothetical protein
MSRQLLGFMGDVMKQSSVLERQGCVIDLESAAEILQGITQAQEDEDYVLLADLLELQLKPWLLTCQEFFVSSRTPEQPWLESNLAQLRSKDRELAKHIEDYQLQGSYEVEYTSSGAVTLRIADKKGAYYLHSNVNPITEGLAFAERYYDEEHRRYVVYGFGLGYHIQELCRLDDGLYIDIIEPDMEIIKQAFSVRDMRWLVDNDRVHLVWDRDYQKLKHCLDKGEKLLIHYPSLRHTEDDAVKLSLEKYFIHDSGIRNFSVQLANNFWDNILNCPHYVDELQKDFQGKNAVIVAAGPSLDKNVELLRQLPENTIVVAVGTVFRKLVNLGISPDYVVFLDAQPHLYHSQVEGLEQQKIPILCGSTACKKVAASYQGEKYLVCQNGYDEAEKFAGERGYRTYDTGGSVSTIALDICLKLGCKSIAFIGLDLAYTDNLTHASGTADKAAEDGENGEWVLAADGGKIRASKLFIIYREWIERKAASVQGKVSVIDATEGGALKKGLRRLTLREVFEEWT